MKYKQIWKTAAACLMAAVMLPGCSDEEGGGTVTPEDGYATLAISFYSVNSSEPVGTRAPGDPEDTVEEENDYERRIDDWWVLIYNSEGSFVDYLSNTKNSEASEPVGDDSRFTTYIELPVGTYHLYGFANLNTLEGADALLTEESIRSWTEDDLKAERGTPPTGKAVNLSNVLERFNVAAEDRPAIPMSAYMEEVTLSVGGTNEAELGLYRMIGKVSVTISNQTGEPIDLDALSMRNFRTAGNIFLMPYDGLDKLRDEFVSSSMQPIFPEDETASYAPYEYQVAGNEQITDGEEKTYSFYIPETPQEGQENNGSSPMKISFNIPQKGGLNERDTEFDFVRRNDWLNIPVNVSTIDSRLEYRTQNMPIGGLPEVVLSTSTDGILVGSLNTVTVSKAGPIEFKYSFTTIAGFSDTEINIRYDESEINTGLNYSHAELTQNGGENSVGLVIDPNTGTAMSAPAEIKLTPDNIIDDTNPQQVLGNASGMLTVHTQELGNAASATIEVKLVAVCTDSTTGTTSEVEIPYTIIINNDK